MTRVFEGSVRAYRAGQRLRSVAAPVRRPVLRDVALVPGVDLDHTRRLWEIE